MADELKQQIGDQAEHIAQKLADATQQVGRPRPERVAVGPWSLLKLNADEDTMWSAQRMREQAESIDAPGRGFDFWHARPDLIKFTFAQPLAAAYRATGDAGYAAAFRTLLEDYFASLQPPKWAGGGMRLSSRIGHWAQYLPYFLDAPSFDEAFVQRVVAAVPEQLASILKTQKVGSRGNIRMLETNGMFWVGLGLPMVAGANEALARARWVFADTAAHAVYSDGSYQEYDMNYHEVFQGAFYNVMLWRAAFPELDLPDVTEAAVRVFEYAALTKSPIGHACGMQESPTPWISDVGCETVLAKRAEVRRLAGQPDTLPPLQAVCSAASQAFLRTSWDRDAMFVGFDASRWGGAHSHLARNSVLLFAFGRGLLPDTGSLTYAMGHKAHEGDALDHKIGPYGKSTRAHNTLNLNGWNQAPTNADSLRGYFAVGCSAVISQYSGGYWPGRYDWWFSEGFGAGLHAEHQRMLFWIPGRFIVVVDRMLRWEESTHGHAEQQNPSLEMNWQLSPGGQVELTAEHPGFTAVYPEGGLLGRFVRMPEGMTLGKHEGETDPPRGWITTRTKAKAPLRRAGVFDQPPGSDYARRSYVPAPQIAGLADPMPGFGESLVSVFVPFQGATAPALETELSGAIAADHAQQTAGELTLRWGDGSRDALVWSGSLLAPVFECAPGGVPMRTDANAVHMRLDASGAVQEGSALNASLLESDALDAGQRERIRVGSRMEHAGGF